MRSLCILQEAVSVDVCARRTAYSAGKHLPGLTECAHLHLLVRYVAVLPRGHIAHYCLTCLSAERELLAYKN